MANVKARIKVDLDRNPGEDSEVLLWFLGIIKNQRTWEELTVCRRKDGQRHWSATDELLTLAKGFPG